MTIFGWLQIAAVLGAVLLCAWPLGIYMARVFDNQRTFLTPVLGPIESGHYAACEDCIELVQRKRGNAMQCLRIDWRAHIARANPLLRDLEVHVCLRCPRLSPVTLA